MDSGKWLYLKQIFSDLNIRNIGFKCIHFSSHTPYYPHKQPKALFRCYSKSKLFARTICAHIYR